MGHIRDTYETFAVLTVHQQDTYPCNGIANVENVASDVSVSKQQILGWCISDILQQQ